MSNSTADDSGFPYSFILLIPAGAAILFLILTFADWFFKRRVIPRYQNWKKGKNSPEPNGIALEPIEVPSRPASNAVITLDVQADVREGGVEYKEDMKNEEIEEENVSDSVQIESNNNSRRSLQENEVENVELPAYTVVT